MRQCGEDELLHELNHFERNYDGIEFHEIDRRNEI